MGISSTKIGGDGEFHYERIDAYGRRLVNPAWTHVLESDTTVDDSDKSFEVPALKEWSVQSIHVEYSASATFGTRQVLIEIQNAASDVIMRIVPDHSFVESTVTHFTFCNFGGYSVVQTLASSIDVYTCPLPPLILPAGYIIRVYDIDAIDAAADDMVVHIRALQRDLFEEPV